MSKSKMNFTIGNTFLNRIFVILLLFVGYNLETIIKKLESGYLDFDFFGEFRYTVALIKFDLFLTFYFIFLSIYLQSIQYK